MTSADPIRAALERLVEAVEDYEPIWGGFPESALAEAQAALAEPVGEGEVGEVAAWLRLFCSETPVPEEAAEPWKDALIDALVCAFLLNEEELLEEPDEDDFGDNEDPKRWARYQRWLNSDQRQALHDLISWEVQLAKDPLINSPVHPTPVPVSEGAPGPKDCYGKVNCWWFDPHADGAWYMDSYQSGYTHWLPAHALPMPQGEVEK
jgi:hypothetical protein